MEKQEHLLSSSTPLCSNATTAPAPRAQLAKRCVLFTLEHFQEASETYDSVGFSNMLVRMVPYLHVGLLEDMQKIWGGAQGQPPRPVSPARGA